MLCTALFACAFATSVHAEPVTLMVGDPAARHVTFDFSDDRAGAEALTIATHRVGNPDAILTIWVDRSPTPLLKKTLGQDGCGFDDSGASCRLVIAGDTKEYARFVASFKAGRTVHVEVQNASTMEMQEDLTLIGFTKSYGG